MAPDYIIQKIKNQKIIILGFGKEGVSTYHFIRKYFPKMPLAVADRSEALCIDDLQDSHLTVVKGADYDQNLNRYDLIFKTPGVSFNNLNYLVDTKKITSQTNLFLEAFHQQIIGVTGTKGKSTTASLIYHLLKSAGKDTILAGNIGVPFFDIIDKMNDTTLVVAELSAHQLEYVHASPDYAVLLNLYQEHLDHFNSFSNYQLAKMNITKYQSPDNFLVYNGDDQHIPDLVKSHGYIRDFCIFGAMPRQGNYVSCHNGRLYFAQNGEVKDEYDLEDYKNLPGTHNFYNIMAAMAICKRVGLAHDELMSGLKTFHGLPNRIEFVGKFNGISFYNDSISTIPEATIAALKALHNVDTLILGGFDRGIAYDILIEYLHQAPVPNVVFIGPAGKRIMTEWEKRYPLPNTHIWENDFDKIIDFAFEHTRENKIVLLSPAAASYDQFKNFEERGRVFKTCIEHKMNSSSLKK